MPLTISAKSSTLDSSILDVALGPEYASCYVRKDTQILQNGIFFSIYKEELYLILHNIKTNHQDRSLERWMLFWNYNFAWLNHFLY